MIYDLGSAKERFILDWILASAGRPLTPAQWLPQSPPLAREVERVWRSWMRWLGAAPPWKPLRDGRMGVGLEGELVGLNPSGSDSIRVNPSQSDYFLMGRVGNAKGARS
jgi:hypothetical protein